MSGKTFSCYLKTGTVRYNNKILVSDGKFILGKNDEVNSLETPAIKINSLETPAIESHSNTAQGLTHAPTISHDDEKTEFYFWELQFSKSTNDVILLACH